MEERPMGEKQERDNWLRKLNSLQQENIFLKNSLADLLKNDVSPAMLEQVEYFQNQFLNKDTVIILLRHDIVAQNKLADNDSNANKMQNKLRADMEKMENEFSQLKFKFNQYLAGVM